MLLFCSRIVRRLLDDRFKDRMFYFRVFMYVFDSIPFLSGSAKKAEEMIEQKEDESPIAFCICKNKIA